MKKVIIVHCWEGYPEYCWYPHVKNELQNKGFEVNVSLFPETNHPQLNQWLPKLKEIVGKPNENIFLVGHSIGAVTILRYLESMQEQEKIGGVVLVAGFTDDLGYVELSNFFNKPLDFEKIKKHTKKIVAIHSDNDPYVSLKYGDIFRDIAGAELIIKHDMKHFSRDCIELPDVVEAIVRIAS